MIIRCIIVFGIALSVSLFGPLLTAQAADDVDYYSGYSWDSFNLDIKPEDTLIAQEEKNRGEITFFERKEKQLAQADKQKKADGQGKGGEGKTGTDPRDFGSKFMPYYLHTKLRNNLQVDQLNLFGMIAIDPKSLAITYDLPVAKRVNYSNISAFKAGTGGLPPETPTGGAGLPFSGLEADGDTFGTGDLGLRFFYKPASLTNKTTSHMFGAELTIPTASKDLLGGDTWVLSPLYVFVHNVHILSPGFVAFMNFYDFDIAKERERPNVSRYRGRWFLMQPLSRPGPGLLDGIYLLPELQPVIDFENDTFSLWLAPEVGKVLAPGRIMYIKPGIGLIHSTDADREWTLEIGFRWFL